MDKKDLYVLTGISVFVAVFFLTALRDCFVTSFDVFISNMAAMGLFIVPVMIGIFFYKKEVKKLV